MTQKRVEELEKILEEARNKYYNLNPIMSDQEYDRLRDELIELNPDSKEVKAVGADPIKISVWEKVPHEIPMGSLNKVNSKEEFSKWYSNVQSPEIIITHKLDGSSMELIYENGEIVRCVTRGNGTVGEDITENVTKIPNIPHSIPIKNEKVIIRGEVMMLKSIFEEKYSSEYANPRNTSAGKLRDKKNSGESCRDLHFVAFYIHSKGCPKKEDLVLKILSKIGFEIPPYEVGSLNEIEKWHNETGKNRGELPYEIDGTVIKINDMSIQNTLGSKNMRPRGQIAWKFDPEMAETTLESIKWQVGHTGRVTPVAVIAPCKIGGVIIKNVSLHNLAMFKSLKLSEKCRLVISRRNEVIPYIEANITESIYL
jgi:DNA ligase (NAD+)